VFFIPCSLFCIVHQVEKNKKNVILKHQVEKKEKEKKRKEKVKLKHQVEKKGGDTEVTDSLILYSQS
jgi:hypothetical protein